MTTAPPQVPFNATLRDGRTVHIRLIEAGDNERLIALGAALPENDWLHVENDLRSPEVVARLVNARDAEHWRQIVAVAPDGAIVAYASARLLPGRSSHVADIQLIVDEAWRRCGLGAVMAGEIVAHARQLGAAKVFVDMVEEQTAGQAIFTRLGFTLEGRLINHIRDRQGKLHNLVVLACHVE
ncbi:MAG: GNAT family N-acetyltransferase [Roseiflexus sp.]|nr:GNAT family N-acetyltransferase [Roseiflexus sp.]MCS7290515.1 GNAT family N-acetyltransferase [Roseiflexus sp.]MDW8148344.1 GNAT family N-acetyltransferase [Roseiflexaceae bacterium]